MCFYDKNEFHLNCPLCKKSYCLQCKTEWHKDKTCEEYQLEKKDKDNDIKFEEYAKGNNFKQCPNCKRWVEKISGCDFIACPCGTNFCYSCGGVMGQSHYHDCPKKNNNRTYNLFFNNNPVNLFGNNYLNNNNIFGVNQNNYINYQNNNNQGLFGNIKRNNQITFGFVNNKNNYNDNNKTNLFGNNNNTNNTSLFGNNNNNIF